MIESTCYRQPYKQSGFITTGANKGNMDMKDLFTKNRLINKEKRSKKEIKKEENLNLGFQTIGLNLGSITIRRCKSHCIYTKRCAPSVKNNRETKSNQSILSVLVAFISFAS